MIRREGAADGGLDFWYDSMWLREQEWIASE